jgi:hypothetical protein
MISCDRWFAIDKGDGLIDRILTVSSLSLISSFSYLWKQRWMSVKRDHNVFTSIYSASRFDLREFTRTERITNSAVFIVVILLTHALYFNNYRLIHVEAAEYYTVNYYSMYFAFFGLWPALIIRTCLEWLFRHSKPFKNMKKSLKYQGHNDVNKLNQSKRNQLLNMKVSVPNVRSGSKFDYKSVLYCSKGSLHGQKEFSIIFNSDLAGEFTVFDISTRARYNNRKAPKFVRLFAWLISIGLFLGSLLTCYYLYLDFEFLRRIHWLKTNILALIFIVAIVEPMKLSFQAFVSAYFKRNCDIWDWIVPINQPIRIQSHSKRNSSLLIENLKETRMFDDRYRPVNINDLHLAYQSSVRLKTKTRVIKKILFLFGLFLCSVIIILFETNFATGRINDSIKNFWISDFNSISTRSDLEHYLSKTLTSKFYNQDEYGNVNGFSEDGSIVFISDLNVRQVRSVEASNPFGFWNHQTFNFSTSWAANKTVEKQQNVPWRHSEFWNGRSLVGEFFGQYPSGGYSIHLFANSQMNNELQAAIKAGWIDKYTRMITVNFALYCASDDIFSNVQLVAEIPIIGNIYTGIDWYS